MHCHDTSQQSNLEHNATISLISLQVHANIQPRLLQNCAT